MRTCGRRLAARLTSFVGWPAKSALAPGGRILTLKVMQFAPQQDEALKAVSQWLKGGRS
ncbi:ATP-binding protein, partial [Sinorhizobium meliloti]